MNYQTNPMGNGFGPRGNRPSKFAKTFAAVVGIIFGLIVFIAVLGGSGDGKSESTKETSSEESTTQNPANEIEYEMTFFLTAGIQGEYGKTITYNAGTEFEESFFAYYVPNGKYMVKNVGDYPTQVNAYSDEITMSSSGFEEPVEGSVITLKVGETKELTVPEGWHIEITEPTMIQMQKVKENPNSEETTPGKTTPAEDQISFNGNVVVDNAECGIKITAVEYSKSSGLVLKTQFENKSNDKVYMYSVDSAAINGVMCDPFFATEVAAGKKANKNINFYASKLEEIGIEKCTDIELTFRVYDSDDWSADNVAFTTVHIYPYGEEKAERYVRPSKPSDVILVDNEYVTVIAVGYNDSTDFEIGLFLLNKTDKEVMFSVGDASLNGFMIDPFFAKSILPGKCAYGTLDWSSSQLEENDITDVEEIEFKLKAYDYNDWFSDPFAEEIITLNT
jgi:hypothetical protein